MKRISLAFMAMLLTSLFLVSCGNDDNNINVSEVDQFSNPANNFSNQFCGQVVFNYFNQVPVLIENNGGAVYVLQADSQNQFVVNFFTQIQSYNQAFNACVYSNIAVFSSNGAGFLNQQTILVQHVEVTN